jgi:hypothetical protein
VSGKYLAARQAWAIGKLSWTRDALSACLLSSSYVFDEAHALQDALRFIASEKLKLEGRRSDGGGVSCSALTFKSLFDVPTALLVYRENLPIAYLDDIQGLPISDPEQYEVTLSMPRELFTV